MRARGLDEHVGRVLGRRYRLLAPIGSGGSARVYLAEDLSLHRRVAVKLLHAGLAADPRFARRFESEARSSAQLNHPHVLAVYDWSDTDPAYLVSELLEGGSLRSLLDGPNPTTRTPGEANRCALSPSQALMVGLQAAQGLAYAHERGFVHRDIKPANLLFDGEGRLRIADFGIARAVAEAAWTEPEGALVGTARYAAPEQASTEVVDGRADVYGLALSLVEAVTGNVPLTAPTALSTMLLRQDSDLVVPSELGPLGPVLAAAGRADPAERIDAATFARGLHRAASSLPRPKRLSLVPIDVIEVAAPDPAAPAIRSGDEASVDATGTIVLSEPPIDLRSGPGAGGPADVDPTDVGRSLDVSSMATSVHRAVEPDFRHDTAEMATGAVEDDDGDDDDVIDVEDVRRRWPFVVLLLLLVAGAAAVYTGRDLAPSDLTEVFATPTHPMGTFVGQDIESVLRDIELNNWLVEVDDTIRQDGSVPGEVLAQSPDPGVEYEEGLVVTLVVSAGLELREVPTLVGRQRADAEQALTEVKLVVGTVTEVDDEEVPVGEVIAASADPGAELESGGSVDLTISRGPAPRTVPPIQGLDPAGAQQALEAIQLVFVGGEENSRDVPEGDIISITPEVGSTLERGGEVTVIFSTGRPFVVVPNVTGMSAAEAADELQAAGFWVQDTEGPPNSEVLATNPPAGETHREGTAVIIFTR